MLSNVFLCYWIAGSPNCFYHPHPKDGEGTVFTGVCVHTWGGRGGLPQTLVLSQVTGPRSFPGGYPCPRFFPRSLVPGSFQGHQFPGPFWGYSSPRFFPGHWSQVLSGGYPSPGQGYSSPGRGYPSPAGGYPVMEYPLARIGLGYPPAWAGWGIQPGQMGCPPPLAWSGWGTPPGQNSRASTCYAAGGKRYGGLSCWYLYQSYLF